MRSANDLQLRKFRVSMIGMIMLFAVLFSSFYIASEADHDCMGSDCPVCGFVQQCENTLHSFGGDASDLSSAGISVVILIVFFLFLFFLIRKTPVSNKERLNC